MTKALALGTWGLILLIGFAVLIWRLVCPSQPTAIAAKQIAPNHLIQPGDLDNPSPQEAFLGRYSRSIIAPGQILGPKNFATVPLLATLTKPLFVVATQPDLVTAGSVDVNTSGKICNKDGAVGEAEVVAIFCAAAKDGRPCFVLVTASAETGPKLKPNESTFLPACASQSQK